MEEGALLGGMSSPEEAMVPDLFGADGGFVSENMPLKAAAVVRAEEEEFHVLKDPYLSAADPKGPLLHAFNPPLSADCKSKAKGELLVEENDEEMLGEFPRLPELDPLEDAVLPAAPPPQAYSVHFLSPVRTAHGSPAVVPLGAWAREGAAHTSVRVIPVEVKEGGGASEIPEEAALQNPLSQEAHMFRSSQEVEGASGMSHQDTSPVMRKQRCRTASWYWGPLGPQDYVVRMGREGSQGPRPKLPVDKGPTPSMDCRLQQLPTPRKRPYPEVHTTRKHLKKSSSELGPAVAPSSSRRCLWSSQAHGRLSSPPTTVLCRLRGAAPALCADGSSAAGLQALHWAPRGQDASDSPRSDGPRPVTALVGRLLPVPAKLNLITQQLGEGASAPAVSGPTVPAGPALAAPPRTAVAGSCDCFAGGDFCSTCTCTSCRSGLRLGAGRLTAVKAKTMGSSACKCIGCRRHQESPARTALVAAPACAEPGGAEGGLPRPGAGAERRSSCISWEVVEATCACLLAQGEEAERAQRPEGLAQQMILEEFGRCLSQILHTEFKSKGLTVE